MVKPRVFGTKSFIYTMIGTVIVIGIVVGTIFIIRATKKKKKLVVPLIKPLIPLCPEHCLKCDKDGKCLICKSGWETPGKNCTVKVQVTPITRICPEHCLTCDKDGKCTECGPKWQNLAKGCMVPACPPKCGPHGHCDTDSGHCDCDKNWLHAPDHSCSIPNCYNGVLGKNNKCNCGDSGYEGEFCDKYRCKKGYKWYKSVGKCLECPPGPHKIINKKCGTVCYDPQKQDCLPGNILCDLDEVCGNDCLKSGEVCVDNLPCGGILGTPCVKDKTGKFTQCCTNKEMCEDNICQDCDPKKRIWCNNKCCPEGKKECTDGVCCTKGTKVCPEDKVCCEGGTCCSGKCCPSDTHTCLKDGTCCKKGNLCQLSEETTICCSKCCGKAPNQQCCDDPNMKCLAGVCKTYCGTDIHRDPLYCNLNKPKPQICVQHIPYKGKEISACKNPGCEFTTIHYAPGNIQSLDQPLCEKGPNQIVACQTDDPKGPFTRTASATQHSTVPCTEGDCLALMKQTGIYDVVWDTSKGPGKCTGNFNCRNTNLLPYCHTDDEKCPYLHEGTDLPCCKDSEGNYTGQVCQDKTLACYPDGTCGTPAYACDLGTKECKLSKTGTLWKNKQQCQEACPTYKCDSKSLKCIPVIRGPYPTEEDCQEKCVAYDCDSTSFPFKCNLTPGGKFPTLKECQTSCIAKYNCDTTSTPFKCIPALHGKYDTQAECQSECVTKYNCDMASLDCTPLLGGQYTTLEDCQKKCVQYNCVNYNCEMQKGGQYSTLADCQNRCKSCPTGKPGTICSGHGTCDSNTGVCSCSSVNWGGKDCNTSRCSCGHQVGSECDRCFGTGSNCFDCNTGAGQCISNLCICPCLS